MEITMVEPMYFPSVDQKKIFPNSLCFSLNLLYHCFRPNSLSVITGMPLTEFSILLLHLSRDSVNLYLLNAYYVPNAVYVKAM